MLFEPQALAPGPRPRQPGNVKLGESPGIAGVYPNEITVDEIFRLTNYFCTDNVRDVTLGKKMIIKEIFFANRDIRNDLLGGAR